MANEREQRGGRSKQCKLFFSSFWLYSASEFHSHSIRHFSSSRSENSPYFICSYLQHYYYLCAYGRRAMKIIKNCISLQGSANCEGNFLLPQLTFKHANGFSHMHVKLYIWVDIIAAASFENDFLFFISTAMGLIWWQSAASCYELRKFHFSKKAC